MAMSESGRLYAINIGILCIPPLIPILEANLVSLFVIVYRLSRLIVSRASAR